MTADKMTTMEVRKINRHSIYTFIYEQKTTSKQQIVDSLHLSLSTVTQNLKLLEEENLICRQGYYESTGGRKARKIEIVRNARTALGIGILKDRIHLAAIDLYGDVIKSSCHELAFAMEDAYYRKLGELVSSFLEEAIPERQTFLGAGIAIQGVISHDGARVSYGPILKNTGLELKDLARYLPCKSLLFHDSKAAAWAELWSRRELNDAVVLLLNNNLGGALILNRQIHYGQSMYGGLIEHISVSPDGPLCYCGSRGCLETYLSADSLKRKAGCDLDTFFKNVRSKKPESTRLWKEYLQRLAFTIRNLQIFTDAGIVISGLLNDYMLPEDFSRIKELTDKCRPFSVQGSRLLAGQHGPLAPATGAALFFVKDWLEQV